MLCLQHSIGIIRILNLQTDIIAKLLISKIGGKMEGESKLNLALSSESIRSLVYLIRNKQVMLDNDLAKLYQIETRALNQAVKRNIKRFPEEFCFQLTDDENQHLKSQNVIANSVVDTHGGRRTNVYAFTEQGVAMLSAVLRSDIAITVSINIMKAFVEMRHFISNNALLFEKISNVELKQLEYQNKTDHKLDVIFNHISANVESNQKIFFDGQIYDAFSLLCSIVKESKRELILIDNYVDVETLNILKHKCEGVDVIIYTLPNTRLSQGDINKFNSQYPYLKVKHLTSFHDRFMIIDGVRTYHIGASLKDAGKKCFGISLLEDGNLTKEIISRLHK